MQSRSQFQQNKSATPAKEETALRCCCGSLLARLVADGVEIKCRRCKRQVILPVEAKGTARLTM
jgi:phage FluMu protein Com